MAGTFLLGERKIRAGTYFRREASGITAAGAINGILACLFQSNWGELNKVVDVTIDQLNNLEELYGTGATILREGFLGGAHTIRAYRVGGTGGAASKVILKTADTTPKDGVEVAARFPGARTFSATVRDNLVSGRRQLYIYNGTEIFTSVEFDKGGDEAAALVEALATNRYFVGTKKNAGTLADVAQANLTGGANPSVTNDSYAAGTDALERYRWNCIVADSDSIDVKNILYNFVTLSYETGHLGMACIAGKSSESLDNRIALAASYNDEKMIYLLNGWIGNDGTTYDGWLAAARLGGMIAGCDTNTSLTGLVIDNALNLIEPLTSGEVERAIQKGCLVLSLNEEDQPRIDTAVTTLVTPNANMDEGWKKIKRTKLRFEVMTRVNRTCDKLIGRLNNDSNGRSTLLAAAQGVLNEMIGEGKLFAGSNIVEDERYKPEGDHAYFLLTIGDVDALEKIYLTYRFSYA